MSVWTDRGTPAENAPHLLRFNLTDIHLANWVDWAPGADARGCTHMIAQAMDGFGITNSPKGRACAYADLLALWGETPEKWRAWATSAEESQSSCALVARSVWRLLGVKDEGKTENGHIYQGALKAPYKDDTVTKALEDVARRWGALRYIFRRDMFLNAHPGRGDFVLLYGYDEEKKKSKQHVITILDPDEQNGTYYAMQGGDPGSMHDGSCNGITTGTYVLAKGTTKKGSPYFVGHEDEPIVRVIQVEKLKFDQPVILLTSANGKLLTS